MSFLLIMTTSLYANEDKPAYALFYANSPAIDVLSQFDRIILEADNVNDEEIKQLKQHGASVYAYLSIGEINPSRRGTGAVDSAWVLAENETWQSQVLDLQSKGWQDFLMQRAQVLLARGFQGFFLDTLDSYHIAAKSDEEKKQQEQGLIQIIKGLSGLQDNVGLVANRGFEVLEHVADKLEAVAAESLYKRWDHNKKRYTDVPVQDREWLSGQLQKAQQHGLHAIAIDYLPPEQREQARETAKQIAADGFIPWIATPELDYIGIGLIEAIPRRLLFLYDGQNENIEVAFTESHRMGAIIAEYQGYVPEFLDINNGLPQGILQGVYAGVVPWFRGDVKSEGYKGWLLKRFQEKLPVLILGHPGITLDNDFFAYMGLEASGDIDAASLSIETQSELIGYEIPVPKRIDYVQMNVRSIADTNQVHLRMSDKDGRSVDLAVMGEWGGFAQRAALIDEDFNHDTYWVLSPFPYFKQALKLVDIPVPDVTTENGRRMFLVHIDGDGFMSKAEMQGTPYGAKVVLDQVIKPFKVPHTVSIIEGEIGKAGLYADDSENLEAVARDIFREPHVEIASHSYSHPFFWRALSSDEKAKPGQYNLPVPDYSFDLEREIRGSVEYINSRLAPPGKKTKIFLWTGDTLPTPEALALTEELGLLNMNGGLTTVSHSRNSLINVSGMERHQGGYKQIYAPVLNENVYTNNWLGPYYGFRRAVETFEMTNKPRRLKPINIYYHFYSGTKPSALRALIEVYEWSMKQDIYPLYGSEFILKAMNYSEIGVARYLDFEHPTKWRVSGMKQLHSLRVNNAMGWPNLLNNNILGVRQLHDGRYIHTRGQARLTLKLDGKQPTTPYLWQSNAAVTTWEPQANQKTVRFRLQGHVPVILEVAGQCHVTWSQGKKLKPVAQKEQRSLFHFPKKDTGDASLHCI